jgi:hypothetical protein
MHRVSGISGHDFRTVLRPEAGVEEPEKKRKIIGRREGLNCMRPSTINWGCIYIYIRYYFSDELI